jgi:galactokinase/mevalonate kinase-like predicted kinase
VDLAGGAPDAVTVTVAIDRRAWCRVETRGSGVLIESKDTLRKTSGRGVAEVLESESPPPVARVLRAMGVETGLRVVTQLRVPEGSGLGESPALGAAVAGAVARVLERKLDSEEIARVAIEAEGVGIGGAPGTREGHTAVRGGALAFHPEAGGVRLEPLAVDPARIEESLLLVEGKRSPGAGAAGAALRTVASRVYDALRSGRLEDVVGLWAEEWEARQGADWPAPETARIAEVVRGAGGGARVCGAGRGGILAVWAPPGTRGPGRREAVVAAAKAAGLRLFPARVDLRGLDVE